MARSCQVGTKTGYVNLYLEGPFSLAFVPTQNSVIVLAMQTPRHHEPSFISGLDEAVIIKCHDYELVARFEIELPR